MMATVLALFPAMVLCAESSPPAPPEEEEFIFREDFQSCAAGQTNRPGYWTTSTRGPGRVINWLVQDIGAMEPDMVFRGRGMTPWEGEWRTETIDISSYREAEISIDVYSNIYSDPEDNCYVYFFYQTGTGSPVIWFSQTGTITPTKTFIRLTSPPVYGDNLVFIFRASTEDATGDDYQFRRIRVSGTRLSLSRGLDDQD